MKLILSLPDEVAEVYASRLRPSQTLEQVLSIQLERFASVDPRDRSIIIDPVARGQLEALTTRLPLTSAEELVRRVAELAELSVGRIRIPWTPTQWRELKAKAERWRMSPADYAATIVRQIEEQFFSETPKPGTGRASGAAGGA